MRGQNEKDTYTYKAVDLSPLTSVTHSTHESSNFVNVSSQNYNKLNPILCFLQAMLTIVDYEPLIHERGPWGT